MWKALSVVPWWMQRDFSSRSDPAKQTTLQTTTTATTTTTKRIQVSMLAPTREPVTSKLSLMNFP